MKTNQAKGFGRLFAHALVVACVSFVGGTASAAWTDGLVQYWDFSQGDPTDTAVEPAEIVDALSRGSATLRTATRIDGAHPSDATKALKVPGRVCYTNMEVQIPFYGNVTNVRTCLWIPQDTADDNGTTKYCSRQVRLPAPATAENFGKCTVFLRFYLAKQNAGVTLHNIYSYGTAYNGTTGWGIVCQTTGSDGGSLNISYGNCWKKKTTVEVYGKKDPYQGGTFAYLQTGHWYDMVVTVDPSSQEDNVNLYLCQSGKWYRDPAHSYAQDYQADMYHYRMSVPILAPTSANNLQILGAGEDVNGWGGGEQSSWGTFDGFKHGVWGAFERLMVWNRVLTKEEAYDAMMDATGRNIEVGAKNDSADEFAKTGAATIADVYDASTMPWCRMRKELTAANPALSLKFKVPVREAGLSRTLTVDPILTGTGETVPVAATIGGTALDPMDWAKASGCELYIPGELVVPDDTGYVTLTLTRTGDTTGTAAIDHLSFGGSWQIGADDGSEPFRDSKWLPTVTTYVESLIIDDNYSNQFVDTLYGTNSEGTCYTRHPCKLRFVVPSELAANHRSRFTFVTRPQVERGDYYPYQAVRILVNGQEVATRDGLKAGANTFDLPDGTFSAGANVLEIVNTTDVSARASYWGTYSPKISFAAKRLVFRDLPKGLLLLVR